MVLGKSIAQAGRKVLIIDADLHKTSLSKRMQLLDKPGFRESLKDKAAESLHVFPTETDGLEVMPAGQQSDGPIMLEEIANGAFKSCVGRLFQQHGYDIILVDTPPILPVADAIILAGQVDGTVLVEREHVSRRTEVANALVRLGSAGGRLLGTVFVGSVDHDHYGYGYGYYGKRT
jgi:capsular exopolysaccharide synthesis family protein